MLLDDADIKVYKRTKKQMVHVANKVAHAKAQSTDITMQDLAGKVTFILNGKSTNKSRLGFFVVKEYLTKHPETTIGQLKKVFHNDLLGDWNQWGVIEEDIDYAKSLKDSTGAYRHQTKRQFILRSGDGVKFVVSNQWSTVNVVNLVKFIQKQGWDLKIKKEE